MISEVTKADIEQQYGKVVVLHSYNKQQKEAMDFLQQHCDAEGYNAGVYGWNYNVYNINGIAFVEGYRVPNFRNEVKFSNKILETSVNEAYEVVKNARKPENIKSYSRIQEQLKISDVFKKFTDSVEQGICDPSTIRSFADYKRELIDQKNQNPTDDLLKIAQSLSSYFYDDETKNKISGALENRMQKYTNLSDNKQKLNSVLNDIYNSDPKIIRKNIFNELNRKDRFPDGISDYAELRAAQAVFNGISKGGVENCGLKNIADFYKNKGAFVKESKDKTNWTISLEKPKAERKIENRMER